MHLFRSFLLLATLPALIVAAPCEQVPQTPAATKQPPSGAAPFSLAASAELNVVQAGAPVKVKVVTTNTSNQQIDFYVNPASDRAGWVFKVDVTDENGNAPPDTRLGRVFKYNEKKSPDSGVGTFLVGKGAFISLQPGESVTDVTDVSTLYDFSVPGKYSIQVQRFTDNDVLVKANTVSVTITPGSAAQSTSPATAAFNSPPFSLTITTPTGETVKAGSPMGLLVVTTNTSGRNILLWAERADREQAGSGYQIDVRRTNGTPPDTDFGQRAKARTDVPRDATSAQFVDQSGEKFVLKPGESWTDTILVNDLYDLRQPGDYTIQVERFDPATSTMVKSNTITVTVAPKP
jgi:hypothetical protein